MIIKISFLVSFVFCWQLRAAGSCSLREPKQIAITTETSKIHDRDYIQKLLNSAGYHKEIYEAIQNYKELYGIYPNIIDKNTGLISSRRIGGMASDGKWLVLEPDGTASWIYNANTGYTMIKKDLTGQKVWSKEKERYGNSYKIVQDLDDGRYVVTAGRGIRVIKGDDLSITPIQGASRKPRGRLIQLQPAAK